MPAAGDQLLEAGRARGRLGQVPRLRVELAGETLDRIGFHDDACLRREHLPGGEILEISLLHRRLLSSCVSTVQPSLQSYERCRYGAAPPSASTVCPLREDITDNSRRREQRRRWRSEGRGRATKQRKRPLMGCRVWLTGCGVAIRSAQSCASKHD